MIVCATPRSGATKFAFDKAKELNITYLDEVRPGTTETFMTGKWNTGRKYKFHELPYSRFLDFDTFHKISKDPTSPEYIILANGTGNHWLFDKADWYVARRDLFSWLCSICNFWLKNRNGQMGLDLIQTYLSFMIENAIVLYDYCSRYNKKIEWYEDMPYAKQTTYTLFTQHVHYKEVIKTMDYYVKYSKILDTNKELSYDKGF